MLKIENINKYFNKNKKNQIHVINNTSLEFNNTGLIAILGPSGCGKTTLLNVIGGLDSVDSGEIYINNKKITNVGIHSLDKIRNLNIGYIFQDYKLIEDISVFENIALSLKILGIKNKRKIKKLVNDALESVNLYRYRYRPAKMLSGGQKQRVAVARAIVKNPNIIIADEPTGNLDSKNTIEIMNILKSISKEKLVILVTHEIDIAKFYASRIIEIQDGKIIKDNNNNTDSYLKYNQENKIYLKDLEKIGEINKERLKLEVFADDKQKIDAKLILKNGEIYINSDKYNINLINENSPVEIIDDNFKPLDENIYEKYNYDNTKFKNIQIKYSSVYGIFKSIKDGFKKIKTYSTLKKILMFGYFASAIFVTYSVSNIFGMLNINESEYVIQDKNYLQIDVGQINVEDYLKYENKEGVEYIITGDSMANFNMLFNDYQQTANSSLEVTASLLNIEILEKKDIICGRMPENKYEVVIDKLVIDRIDTLKNGTSQSSDNGIAIELGIKSAKDALNKKIYVNNMPSFTIVGVTDKNSQSLYTYKENFINILDNTNKVDLSVNMYNNENSEKLLDYELLLDDINLVGGQLPVNDYETIVNISKKDEGINIGENTKIKVNNKELKVVGYYESKTNRNNYLVNNNTIKYNLVCSNTNFSIYSNDKVKTIINLKNEYNLNAIDIYEYNKENYIEKQKANANDILMFSEIALVISLVEIYLMMRTSFLSRVKEIGILRAIGVKKLDIYRKFLGEIIAITTAAGMPGIIFMTYILTLITKVPDMAKLYLMTPLVFAICFIIVYEFNIFFGLLPLRTILRCTPASILARNDVE